MNPFIIGGNRGFTIPYSFFTTETFSFISLFLRLSGQSFFFPNVTSGKTTVTPAFLVVIPGKTMISSAFLIGKMENIIGKADFPTRTSGKTIVKAKETIRKMIFPLITAEETIVNVENCLIASRILKKLQTIICQF